MKIDREECPGCGSEQAFRPRWRYHEDRRFITIYIACGVCPYEIDLEVSMVEIEELKNRVRRHQALAARQKQAFGDVQPHTQTAIDSLRAQITQLKGRHIQGKIWT